MEAELQPLFEALDRLPKDWKVVCILIGPERNTVTSNVPVPDQIAIIRKAWRKLRRSG